MNYVCPFFNSFFLLFCSSSLCSFPLSSIHTTPFYATIHTFDMMMPENAVNDNTCHSNLFSQPPHTIISHAPPSHHTHPTDPLWPPTHYATIVHRVTNNEMQTLLVLQLRDHSSFSLSTFISLFFYSSLAHTLFLYIAELVDCSTSGTVEGMVEGTP